MDNTIEESIAKAMAELGIEPDGSYASDPVEPLKKAGMSGLKATPVPHTEDDTPEQGNPPKEPVIEEPRKRRRRTKAQIEADAKASTVEPVKAPASAYQTPPARSEGEEMPSAVFCKIKDNSMALLIPVNFPSEIRELGGDNYNVIRVTLPDMENPKLQELEVFTEPPKPKEPTLEELVAEVDRIEEQIDKAMEEDDDSLVADLMKQRRAIRLKIKEIG